MCKFLRKQGRATCKTATLGCASFPPGKLAGDAGVFNPSFTVDVLHGNRHVPELSLLPFLHLCNKYNNWCPTWQSLLRSIDEKYLVKICVSQICSLHFLKRQVHRKVGKSINSAWSCSKVSHHPKGNRRPNPPCCVRME